MNQDQDKNRCCDEQQQRQTDQYIRINSAGAASGIFDVVEIYSPRLHKALGKLAKAAAFSNRICLTGLPRRWADTRLALVIARNPLFLGKSWQRLNQCIIAPLSDRAVTQNRREGVQSIRVDELWHDPRGSPGNCARCLSKTFVDKGDGLIGTEFAFTDIRLLSIKLRQADPEAKILLLSETNDQRAGILQDFSCVEL